MLKRYHYNTNKFGKILAKLFYWDIISKYFPKVKSF